MAGFEAMLASTTSLAQIQLSSSLPVPRSARAHGELEQANLGTMKSYAIQQSVVSAVVLYDVTKGKAEQFAVCPFVGDSLGSPTSCYDTILSLKVLFVPSKTGNGSNQHSKGAPA